MSKTVFDISMSLDGYITAAERSPDQPLGRDGEQLHQWLLGDDRTSLEYFARVSKANGAVITGRRNYDDSLPWWGADGPTGDLRLPVVVVTHSTPRAVPEGGVYRFVTDGLESALEVARTAAKGRDVTVMGGARLARSFLTAALIDEISLHIVPVLFGQGTRLFDELPDRHWELELIEAVPAARAVHVRYAVRRQPPSP
ncbi:dihydrofolate reductase family protein [Nakamurella lactea]|uniref:dihydrofolate reductase family protein n=1 Tax=Nakamurella lactea TaxID=459515 RepID=UPI0003F9C6AB|nr:dihydrofolate reductase family protein [Nakamurella lactea]